MKTAIAPTGEALQASNVQAALAPKADAPQASNVQPAPAPVDAAQASDVQTDLAPPEDAFPPSQPGFPVNDVRRWMAPGSYWTAPPQPDDEAARFRNLREQHMHCECICGLSSVKKFKLTATLCTTP